jgi:hypothetical protein
VDLVVAACSWVSAGDELNEAPVILLASDPLIPCCAVCAAIICWSGSEEEDDNEKRWKVLRKIITNEVGSPEDHIVRRMSKFN